MGKLDLVNKDLFSGLGNQQKQIFNLAKSARYKDVGTRLGGISNFSEVLDLISSSDYAIMGLEDRYILIKGYKNLFVSRSLKDGHQDFVRVDYKPFERFGSLENERGILDIIYDNYVRIAKNMSGVKVLPRGAFEGSITMSRYAIDTYWSFMQDFLLFFSSALGIGLGSAPLFVLKVDNSNIADPKLYLEYNFAITEEFPIHIYVRKPW